MKVIRRTKERILSMVLTFVMLVSLFTGLTPMEVHAESPADYTFNYAYDCQRDPAWPKMNQNVKMSGFIKPYISSGQQTDSSGTWTLTYDGKFDQNVHTETKGTSVGSVVSRVAEKYSIADTSKISVYKMSKNGEHICYGVLASVFEDGVLFIGTTLSGGAGYYFCNQELTSEIRIEKKTIGDAITESEKSDVSGGTEEPEVPGEGEADPQSPKIESLEDLVIVNGKTVSLNLDSAKKYIVQSMQFDEPNANIEYEEICNEYKKTIGQNKVTELNDEVVRQYLDAQNINIMRINPEALVSSHDDITVANGLVLLVIEFGESYYYDNGKDDEKGYYYSVEGVHAMCIPAEKIVNNIPSLASITTVDEDSKTITFDLDPNKTYSLACVKSEETSYTASQFNQYMGGTARIITEQLTEVGVAIESEETFSVDRITEWMTNCSQSNESWASFAYGGSIITGQDSYSITATNGLYLLLAEVKPEHVLKHNTLGDVYITYGMHAVFIEAEESGGQGGNAEKIRSLADFVQVENNAEGNYTITFDLDSSKKYVISKATAEQFYDPSLFNATYGPAHEAVIDCVGDDVLDKSALTQASIENHFKNPHTSTMGITGAKNGLVSSYGPITVEDGTYVVIYEVKEEDAVTYVDNDGLSPDNSGDYYIIYAAHAVFFPTDESGSGGGENPTPSGYTITFDNTNYSENDCFVSGRDSVNEKFWLRNYGEQAIVDANGTITIEASNPFTVTAEGATIGELREIGDSGYQMTISNFTKDTTIVVTKINNDPEPTGPVITTHPADVTVAKDEVATFSVEATGENLKYQWQVLPAGQDNWIDFPGETNPTYSVTVLPANNGTKYRCVVKNAEGTVTSNAATLTVTIPTITTYTVTFDKTGYPEDDCWASGDGVDNAYIKFENTGDKATVTADSVVWVFANEEFKVTAEGATVGPVRQNTEEGASGYEAMISDFTADTTIVVSKINNDPEPPAHEHTTTEVPAKAATCTTDGNKAYYTCSGCDSLFADANGTTITTAEAVKVAALGHDWTGEWTIIKEATATEDGKKETLCTRGCGQKKVAIIPATGTADDNSNLEKDAEVAPDAPIDEATLNNSKEELLEAGNIFINAEKTQMANGTDARVWIEISKTDESAIASTDKAKIEQEAAKIMGNNPTITYFDADLFKQVGSGAKQEISEPGLAMKITITIPDELLNRDKKVSREFKIIRLHEGQVDVIDGTFDVTTGEFTFETDKFSTYAIVYNEKNADIPVENVQIILPTNTTLTKSGETIQLNVNVLPSEATNKKVTWHSSNPAVATVDSNGKVTAISNGTVVITATSQSGSKSASVTLTVAIEPTVADEPKEAITPAQLEKNNLKINGKLKVEQKSNYIKATWGKVSDADGYKVYVQYCGKSFSKTPHAVIKGAKKNSVTIKKINGKKLNLKKNYKLYVVAYKTIDGKDKRIGKSITAHIVGRKNTKYTNVKKINIKKTKYTLKVKKTATIKASTVLVNKNRKQLSDGHAKEFRYATSNKKVATVSTKGKITAVGKGKCTIYVYARNGYCKKVSVTVK